MPRAIYKAMGLDILLTAWYWNSPDIFQGSVGDVDLTDRYGDVCHTGCCDAWDELKRPGRTIRWAYVTTTWTIGYSHTRKSASLGHHVGMHWTQREI